MRNHDNTKRGVLCKSDRKERDTHPDYKGSINADGVEYWLSAWMKEGAKGKFMSFSLTPKEQTQTAAQAVQQVAPTHRQQAAPVVLDDDSDIPFQTDKPYGAFFEAI